MKIWFPTTLILTLLLAGCGSKPSPSSSTSSSSSEEPTSSSSSQESEDSRPSRPHRHDYNQESVINEATLFAPGTKRLTCECGEYIEKEYYKLDEYDLESRVFQYDGKTHNLRLSGLLPQGLSVQFVNNGRTEIGSQEVRADIYSPSGTKVDSKTATLTIEPYTGFPNIKIEGGAITSKEVYVASTVSVENVSNEDYAFAGVTAGVRLRGNGTLNADKKAYRIKFDKKRNMLGLNQGRAFKSWVLLADYYDYSMQRNVTAFHLGDDVYNHSGGYSSSYAYVNLYLNGVYNGLYILAEQNQAGKGRFNVHEPEETELQKEVGYLVELDDYARNEGQYFTIGGSSDMVNGRSFPERYYGIKTDWFSADQFQTAETIVRNAFKVLLAASGGVAMVINEAGEVVQDLSNSLTPMQAIEQVLDLPSLMKMYYIEEIMKDIDVGFSSFYLYFDFSDGSIANKVTFGSPWDFDWSSGNLSDASVASSQGTYCNQMTNHANPWLYLVAHVNGFSSEFSKYYRLFASNSLVAEAVEYDTYISDCFRGEFNRNFAKWQILGTSQHSYHPGIVTTFHTHDDASNHFLNWINERLDYLDGVYGGLSL